MLKENNSAIENVEILAPAGSFESVVAAVRCGANAVYLGAKQFSARASAENFSLNEISDTVSYCHDRDVKVYLALNTAVTDREIESAAELICACAQCRVDALIVSDLGIISLAKQICPDMPLHASTQMGIASLKGVQMAADLGLSRAVLARELSGNEISKIVEQSPIETEVFVHGAHCICISGQCYFSSLLGSRSGNRGRCAQPCRLDFGIESQKTRYALSLKDMSLWSKLNELKVAGVTSFKIEGRMKRPEYVAAAVSLVKASLLGKGQEEIFSLAEDIFSRSGFTSGFYDGTIDGNMFGFRTKENVENAKKALPKLHELYRKEFSSVALKAKLFLENADNLVLRLTDRRNNSVEASCQIVQNGCNLPINTEKIIENLNKLGATPYYIESVEINLENALPFSPSIVNSLRREAVELLSKKRRKASPLKTYDYSEIEAIDQSRDAPCTIARFERAEQIEAAELLKEIILPIDEILNNLNCLNEYKGILRAELERHAFSSDGRLQRSLEKLKDAGINKVMVQNIAQLKMTAGFDVMFGPFMNVYNSYAIELLSKNSVNSVMASFELSEKSINALKKRLPLGVFVFGKIPLMITRACPLKNVRSCKECKGKGGFLTDRTGRKMRVACKGGISEIYNADTLVADLNSLRFCSADFFVCYFTDEDKNTCRTVIEATEKYKTPPFFENFTRGLYKKGVI